MDSAFESNLLSMNQLKGNVKRSLDRPMEKASSCLSCLRNSDRYHNHRLLEYRRNLVISGNRLLRQVEG